MIESTAFALMPRYLVMPRWLTYIKTGGIFRLKNAQKAEFDCLETAVFQFELKDWLREFFC